MRKKEQQLWDAMRRAVPNDFWVQRIENLVGEGIPDVYVVSPTGASTWVELKAPIGPKRATTRLMGSEGLRPAQINWHLKAASKGLRSFVLIREVATRKIYFIHGKYAATMNEMTGDELEALSVGDEWKTIFWTLRKGHRS